MFPILDAEKFNALFETFKKESAVELLNSYLDDAQKLVDNMVSAMAAGDAKTIRALAHQLKSSSVMMGGIMLSEKCKAVERENSDSSVMKEGVESLLILHRATSMAIQQEMKKLEL